MHNEKEYDFVSFKFETKRFFNDSSRHSITHQIIIFQEEESESESDDDEGSSEEESESEEETAKGKETKEEKMARMKEKIKVTKMSTMR